MPRIAELRTKITITIQCEGCDSVFNVEEQIAGETKFLDQSSGWDTVRQSAKMDLQEHLDIVRKKQTQGDYSFVPLRRCPNCGYVQSYMVRGIKRKAIYSALAGIIISAIWLFFVVFITQGSVADAIPFISVVSGSLWLYAMTLYVLWYFIPYRRWKKKYNRATSPQPRPPVRIEYPTIH